MPTADPSNVLFKIAHPDLYERNPFNVLNLSVNATARDIRRRREDIEAAFDAGTEADEFAGILPAADGRKPPTRAEVADLFAALEDPERRIAYALFWFWPTGKAEKIRNSNESIREFLAMFNGNLEDSLLADGIKAPLEGRHNLAVFHHMAALAGERTGIRSSQTDKHWRSTIAGWNALVNNSDFWHSVSELVSALGDPRLDYKFARSLRDPFAFTFDQINVELAIGYAKKGREADAKRQVEYMKLSQPDSDDVEGTFDDAFAGLLRQTEAVVDAALTEAKVNPKDGLRQANAILAQTDEPLRVSRIVLGKGSSIRDAIVSTIFGGVRGCLVAYGNETKDWDECLKLTEKLKSVAETEEQRKKAEEDEQIIKTNKRQKEEDELCWFCKKNKKASTYTYQLPMYGDVHRNYWSHQITWRHMTIQIPRCQQCAEKHNAHASKVFLTFCGIVFFLFLLSLAVISSFAHESKTFEDKLIGALFLTAISSFLVVFVLRIVGRDYPGSFWSTTPNVTTHPLYKELQSCGWIIGERPPK